MHYSWIRVRSAGEEHAFHEEDKLRYHGKERSCVRMKDSFALTIRVANAKRKIDPL